MTLSQKYTDLLKIIHTWDHEYDSSLESMYSYLYSQGFIVLPDNNQVINLDSLIRITEKWKDYLLQNYEKESQEWKREMKDRVNKNQDWLYPILSAISLWWIGFISDFFDDVGCLRWIELIIVPWFVISLLCVVLNLFLDIYWSNKSIEDFGTGKNTPEKNKRQANIRNYLIYTWFWIQIVLIFISLILYIYVSSGESSKMSRHGEQRAIIINTMSR